MGCKPGSIAKKGKGFEPMGKRREIRRITKSRSIHGWKSSAEASSVRVKLLGDREECRVPCFREQVPGFENESQVFLSVAKLKHIQATPMPRVVGSLDGGVRVEAKRCRNMSATHARVRRSRRRAWQQMRMGTIGAVARRSNPRNGSGASSVAVKVVNDDVAATTAPHRMSTRVFESGRRSGNGSEWTRREMTSTVNRKRALSAIEIEWAVHQTFDKKLVSLYKPIQAHKLPRKRDKLTNPQVKSEK
ncbi:hypothetical protein C8R45DRAFT_1070284 [Mycena sanguinolenta]|nr:hypothetical protein C8R45DRAFT_1070284 [Mycena sanguinolenta]